jgi:hypothetical protein
VKIAVKMQALVALALLSAGLVVAGCKSAPELTKQQAQSLIQAKYDATPGAPITINVNDRGMQQGVSAGYWLGVKRYPNGYWADLKLTPAGQKVLKLVAGGDVIQWRPLSPQDPRYSIAVVALAQTHLKARDIGDAVDEGNNKVVNFSEDTDLSALPGPLAEIARNPGNKLSTRQTAEFTLNNGTWTLQSIK